MPELDPPQLKAAILVARGLSPKEIGDEVGVSVRTIQRWQKLELFAETVSSLRGRL
jgi:DNA-directed RNA polymerase specialized sigma24 family protein